MSCRLHSSSVHRKDLLPASPLSSLTLFYENSSHFGTEDDPIPQLIDSKRLTLKSLTIDTNCYRYQHATAHTLELSTLTSLESLTIEFGYLGRRGILDSAAPLAVLCDPTYDLAPLPPTLRQLEILGDPSAWYEAVSGGDCTGDSTAPRTTTESARAVL